MRALIQRVKKSTLSIDNQIHSEIGEGLCILLGVGEEDTEAEAALLAEKVFHLRIFEDENGKMNRSLGDINGEALVVSQFTLYADTSHGRRPSFLGAARPETAIPLYESFMEKLQKLGTKKVVSGVFGADMLVEIHNDGPVTIWLDTDSWAKK